MNKNKRVSLVILFICSFYLILLYGEDILVDILGISEIVSLMIRYFLIGAYSGAAITAYIITNRPKKVKGKDPVEFIEEEIMLAESEKYEKNYPNSEKSSK